MGRVIVLAVDDDEPVLATTAMRLRRAGYEVVEAESGLAAINILERRSDIAVVLSDCQMPHMSGMELAKIVRKRWPRIPFIAVSGQPQDRDLPDEVHFIPKPFKTAVVVAAIEEARQTIEFLQWTGS
jgi:two-component system cell cycle sensor histidine kinase/response regulator CckA